MRPGRTRRGTRYVPRTLTSKMRSHSSSAMSRKRVGAAMPALLTSAATGGRSGSTAEIAASTWPLLVTSQPSPTACLPLASAASAAVSCAAPSSRSSAAFQREELDPRQLADLLETLEDLREEAGRLDESFSHVMHLSGSPGMAPRLPEFAVRVRELGFDELVIKPPWDDLARSEEHTSELQSR